MNEILDGHWVRDPALRRRLDLHVRDRFAGHVVRSREPSQSVEALCQDLERLTSTGDPEFSFLITCVCALVWALLDGDGLQVETLRPSDVSRLMLGKALKELRHSCFHPEVRGMRIPTERLANSLDEKGAPEFAARLRADHSQLRSPNMARMAVHLLDEFGREVLGTSIIPGGARGV